MPDSTDYKDTQDDYTSELTLGPSELGKTVTLEIYNAAVTFALAQKDASGVASFQSGNEVSLGPGIATFGNCQGIKVKSNATGLPAIVNATMYYIGEVVPILQPNPTSLSFDPNTGDVTVDPMPTTGGGGNVPDGGNMGDVLTKLSGADQDDDWEPPSVSGNFVNLLAPADPAQDGTGERIEIDTLDTIDLYTVDAFHLTADNLVQIDASPGATAGIILEAENISLLAADSGGNVIDTQLFLEVEVDGDTPAGAVQYIKICIGDAITPANNGWYVIPIYLATNQNW
jgi:hypothetical protein